jgi:hypothetical protein
MRVSLRLSPSSASEGRLAAPARPLFLNVERQGHYFVGPRGWHETAGGAPMGSRTVELTDRLLCSLKMRLVFNETGPMAELRSVPRGRSTERGVVTLNDGVKIDCALHDVSETGARLEFRSRIILPRTFKLRFGKSGQEVAVTVMWQKATLAGVRFATSLSELRTARAPLWARLIGVAR